MAEGISTGPTRAAGGGCRQGGSKGGLALGNVIWRSVAEGVGIAALTSVPVLALAVMAPAAWLAVLAVAYPPARSAARTLPAKALRAD